MSDLPDWLTAYAQDCRVLFGLEAWDIVVKLVKAPDNDLEKEGHASINIRYLTAKIELNESMPDEGFRAILMHEMLHVALAPIEQAHLRIRELVRPRLQEHADELFADGLEQTIERMTRAMQREIKVREVRDGE